MAARPRIGITGAERTASERAALEAYAEAVEAAGGEAVRLLPGEAPDGALERLDGLVLSGGADIDPAAYGEPVREGMDVEIDRERDALELPLARAAVERDLPVLGICRGVQVLNVALGGTLYQDVDVERTGRQAWSHQQRRSHPGAPLDAAIHPVAIEPGSRLREIAGADRLGVNTFHHQAIRDPAPGLVVAARAVEPGGAGVIEAVELPGRRFVLGVQWHPERMWKREAACARLFGALVRAASRARVG
jgi:putative glutamine amidotransferase